VEDKMSRRASGVRCQRYTADGGHYEGRWQQGQHHGYGVKDNGRGLIYEGQWRLGQRHGHGTLRRQCDNGRQERVYIGEWVRNVRCGEGKQYYKDGTVYFGQWQANGRHGHGIQWHADGRIYIGEWQHDAMHGTGVLYAANGNRYVGEFEHGCKSGLGVYYHEQNGEQLQQHGMWSRDNCQSSVLAL
ncbi:hypothetical protein KR093_004263, partial [Drosophila rubida]